MSAITDSFQQHWQSNLPVFTPKAHAKLASLWKEVPLTNLPEFLDKLRLLAAFQLQPCTEYTPFYEDS